PGVRHGLRGARTAARPLRGRPRPGVPALPPRGPEPARDGGGARRGGGGRRRPLLDDARTALQPSGPARRRRPRRLRRPAGPGRCRRDRLPRPGPRRPGRGTDGRGAAAGVTDVPAVFINGQPYEGAVELTALTAAVGAAGARPA